MIDFKNEYGVLKGWIIVVIVLTILILFSIGLATISNSYSRYQCSQYEKLTGIPTTYSNWDICYVETESGLQRWDEYKMRVITHE
jgi:hypothetical protein